ncbi:hypothetical protein HK103_005494 [Boothiomyces macroporosus]|uniref:F-box domain-containing protein n=1 Tax=Boothiomyces macroporosus TaxID=261099 RepID=A0AAD5UIZ1_9FUNG|nr:hypothetical protein HK103_005494 [Boothiomyces macroporosus]
MEDLPFDILERRIFYYLKGRDILRLSMISKAFRKRLFHIQVFSKCGIGHQYLWPVLQPDVENTFQYQTAITSLRNCNWIFPQIDISIKTLLQIHQELPRTELLRIKVTAGERSEYITLASILPNLKAKKIQLNGHFAQIDCLELLNCPKVYDLCVGISTNLDHYEENITKYKNFVSLSTITRLSIMHNNLDDQFIAVMKPVMINSKLKYLNLSGNFIENEGARNIAETLVKTNITCLDISFNPIMKNGIQAILSSLPHSKLNELYLGEHLIDEENLDLEYIERSQLETFHFENELTIENQLTINKIISKTKLKNIALWTRTRLFDEFLQQCAKSVLTTVSFGFVFSEEDAFILSCHLPNLPFKEITIERPEVENNQMLFKSLANSNTIKITGFAVDFYSVRDLIPRTNLQYIELYNILDDDICSVLNQSKIRTVVVKEEFQFAQAESMFDAYSKSKLSELVIAVECNYRVLHLAKQFPKEIIFSYQGDE